MRPEEFRSLGGGSNLALAAYYAENDIRATSRARDYPAPCREVEVEPPAAGLRSHVGTRGREPGLWAALKRLLGVQGRKPGAVEPACR